MRDVHPDEVLVKVSMSAICRSDIHPYHGLLHNPCPGILGHEIIGVIDQIGAEIKRDMRGDVLAVGDRITWTEYFHHGESYYLDVRDITQKSDGVRKYGHDLVAEDPHFLGGFAEYCYVMPGTGILKLPDELSDEEATPINCGVATMVAVTEASQMALSEENSKYLRWPRIRLDRSGKTVGYQGRRNANLACGQSNQLSSDNAQSKGNSVTD